MARFFPQLQDYFTRAFPQRRAGRVSGLSLLSRGWESDIYAFRAEWEEEGRRRKEDLVLRVYPGGDAYTKSAGEFKALTLLCRLGYPVPRADLLERDGSPIGMSFLIMERIHGRPLWPVMFRAPDSRRRQLTALFCGLLARLHSLDWRAAVEDPRQFEPEGECAVIERVLHSWQRVIQAQPEALPGFAPAFQWLMDNRRSVSAAPASPVHMDFHPNNLLACKDGSAFVIDWTNFDITDYRFDLAWTLVLVCSVEGWRWREPLLREYERSRGQQVEDLEYFEAAACLRRLYSVLFSLAEGAGRLGMRPGVEKEMRREAPRLRLVYDLLRARTGLAISEVEQFLHQ